MKFIFSSFGVLFAISAAFAATPVLTIAQQGQSSFTCNATQTKGKLSFTLFGKTVIVTSNTIAQPAIDLYPRRDFPYVQAAQLSSQGNLESVRFPLEVFGNEPGEATFQFRGGVQADDHVSVELSGINSNDGGETNQSFDVNLDCQLVQG